MTDIIIDNNESTILAAVVTSLTNATQNGEAVFNTVATFDDRGEFQDKGFVKLTGAQAAVIGLGSDDHVLTDRRRGIQMSLEVVIAAKGTVNTATSRKARITDLLNAARNGLSLDRGADWVDLATGNDEWISGLLFGETERDDDENKPWAVGILPVQICYVIDDKTSH